jgi:hypothetical protein
MSRTDGKIVIDLLRPGIERQIAASKPGELLAACDVIAALFVGRVHFD